MTRANLRCSYCGSRGLREFPGFPDLPRVTSDCRPYPPGGRLFICMHCSLVQKLADQRWMDEIAGIYATYDMYKQACGAEQAVLDPSSNRFELRSDLIVRYLAAKVGFRDGMKLLDVGCGTGVTLEALAKAPGELRLFGLEFDERNLERLRRIRGFERLYLGALGDIPATFEIVTLVHAVEHFPDPAGTLGDSLGRLSADGTLFVQVVDSPNNPFDLVIADHMGHFSATTLSAVAFKQGLEVLALDDNLVRRELAMIARRRATGSPEPAAETMATDFLFAERNLEWLRTVLREASHAAANHPKLGLFGSSVAATWLAGALGDAIDFFVDEDPSRIGRRHLDRPIVAPQDVPGDAAVYVGMAPVSAEAVLKRYAKSSLKLVAPPPLKPL
jgi:2-polyprenyl-3-methyl-5-hydroxy-6-metoxy-1,4-benzoquinol methylase